MIQNKNPILSNLLCGVASFAYPEILELIEDQCLPICDRIVFNEQFERDDGIDIGLEFHHDGSEMIDISFFGKNWSRSIRDDIMPPWWSKAEDLCVNVSELGKDLDGNPFSSSASKNDSSHRQACTNANGLQLSDYQIIECEIRDGQPRTAGIFIKLIKGMDDNDKPSFSAAFDAISGIQRITSMPLFDDKSKAQTTINRLVNDLDDPIYIGIMVGRSHNLKLIFHRLEAAVNMKKILEPQPLPYKASSYLDQINAMVNELVEIDDAVVRPCLDINLQTNIISPRVCFEVIPIKPNVETASWQILERLALVCGLNPLDIVHVRATHQHLPIGQKSDPIVTMLIQKISTPLQKRDIDGVRKKLATLSHYKLCMEPGKVCRIKSYAYVAHEFDV